MRMSGQSACYSQSGRFDRNSFTYTGEYNFQKQGSTWRLELLTSGELNVLRKSDVDIFLVGGGGAGGRCANNPKSTETLHTAGAGGGGGGYTKSYGNITMPVGTYTVQVGVGGINQASGTYSSSTPSKITVNGTLYQAAGGGSGGNSPSTSSTNPEGAGGGNGGSGGGGGAKYNNATRGYGGTKGSNGTGSGGTGQMNNNNYKYPTLEFYELDHDDNAKAYSQGGNGGVGSSKGKGQNAESNTGNGGNGANGQTYLVQNSDGGQGGSGIIIIRKHR